MSTNHDTPRYAVLSPDCPQSVIC